MRKYRNVEVSESQLEDLVRRAPEFIEAGMSFVDRQAFTDRGPLDVLLVDSGGSLVVGELKVIEDDSMLVQGIDYYDYVNRNLDGYARAYDQHPIDANQDLRLFLIAPNFSVRLLNRVKWVGIPVSLFTVQCIEFEDAPGELVPVYKEVTAPGAPQRVEAYTLDQRLAYITDDVVRKLAEGVIDTVKTWDTERISVEPIKYAVSIKVSGRVFAYLEPRRKHFVVSTYDAEGTWTGYPVNSEADLEAAMQLMRESFERLG